TSAPGTRTRWKRCGRSTKDSSRAGRCAPDRPRQDHTRNDSSAAPPRTSIPPCIAHLHDAGLDAHGKRRHVLVRRGREYFAGSDRKARAVPGTYDDVTVDLAAGQDAAVVRAHVLDRVVSAVEVEYRNFGPVDVDRAPGPGRKLIL